ncbi:MAG: GGDEF domain-containing protein [Oceanospirillaceae bacterium]
MREKDFLEHVSDNELEFLRFILSKAEVGSWIRDNLRDLARVDTAMIKMWGMENVWTPGQWIPFSEQMLPMISGLSDSDKSKLEGVFSGKDNSDFFTIQHEINRPDGLIKYCEVRIEVHSRNEEGMPLAITGVNIDTTDLLVSQRKAYVDQLTRIYNRNKLYEMYESGISVTSPHNGKLFLMLDLDSFKSINDNQGHQIGDLALKAFVNAMSSSIRNDDELFRWGGDEFVIVSTDISKEHAHLFIERIIENVSKISEPTDISCSIGAVFLSKSMRIDDALSLSDKELYKVKAENKGSYSIIVM